MSVPAAAGGADERLLPEGESARRALAASPIPHALFDAHRRLRWANAAWVKATGWEDALGVRWLDRVHPEDLTAELPLAARLHDGQLASYQVASRLLIAGDRWLPVGLHVARAGDDLLVVALTPLVESGAAPPPTPPPRPGDDLTGLTGTLSHDFRQHLRLIISYLSLIEHLGAGGLEPRLLAHLRVALSNAERVQAMLADLVRWLRMPGERHDVATCDLAVIWQQVVDGERARIDATGASVSAGQLPIVPGNAALLAELFGHLLRNALVYRDPSGAPPRVEVSAQRLGANWLLAISDDGPGIPSAYHLHVLAPFHRLHTWEQVPGNGMGLALARRIADVHGGGLRIAPTIGPGCTVQVTLPA